MRRIPSTSSRSLRERDFAQGELHKRGLSPSGTNEVSGVEGERLAWRERGCKLKEPQEWSDQRQQTKKQGESGLTADEWRDGVKEQ